MKLKDVQTKDGSISLSKLTGHKVKDVVGYISSEFGEATFVVSHILLEGGEKVYMGGEHDMPYIEEEGENLNLDSETLENLMEQEED